MSKDDIWGWLIIAGICGGAFYACSGKSNKKDAKPIDIENYQYTATNLMTTGPNGEVFIIDKMGKRLTFATKSGVIYKQLNLDAPDSLETYKTFEQKIHNTKDSLFVNAEWIGDKVYWKISTNGLNTRSSSDITLISVYGTPLIPLCKTCNWVPTFDPDKGKTTKYSVEGSTPNIPIDVWNAAFAVSFRATSE